MHSSYELGSLKEKSIQEILKDKPLQDLRQTIAQGEWHSACNICQDLESNGRSSGRTMRAASDEVKQNIDQDIEWFSLNDVVINWSNLCNLTCVYCNPHTSTAWQSVRKIPIVHNKNEHNDLIELAKTHGKNIKGLSLGGGEPLLQRGLTEFLQQLDSETTSVMVTTNLSVDIKNNPVYQELKKWKKVDWLISFDNVDRDKFEYVRNGANWDQFVANIAQMKQDNQHVVAHPAYSIYCAFELVPYYDFCVDNELDMFWCELTHPHELDVRRLPIEIRQQAIDEINRTVEKYSTKNNLALDTLKGYINSLVDNSYLFNKDKEIDVLEWHTEIESVLKKQKTFQELWPDLVSKLRK
jgi:organic radical activating enzyme